MRHVVGGRATEQTAASTSQMGCFETEALTQRGNLTELTKLSGKWIDGCENETLPLPTINSSAEWKKELATPWSTKKMAKIHTPVVANNQDGKESRLTPLLLCTQVAQKQNRVNDMKKVTLLKNISIVRCFGIVGIVFFNSVSGMAQVNFAIAPLPAGALEVVAPVSQKTLVQLAGSAVQSGSVASNDFKGTAALKSDGVHQILTVVPNKDAIPTDLTVTVGGLNQTVRIFPVRVIREDSAVGATLSPPDPTSRDYTVITESTRANTGIFNGTARPTLRTIRISGYRIAIEAGGRQRILERLMPGGSPAGDIELVEIFAREVVVGAPLQIPGASINIYAQSLSFQDHGSQAGCIDITPLGQTPETSPGKDGAPGQDAGSIRLYLTRIDNSGTNTTGRLIASGGPGQMGVQEITGPKGADKPTMPGEPQIGGILRSWQDLQPFIIVDNGPLPADWPNVVVWFYRYDNADEWGVRDTWPGDGLPGTPGGRAGLGGQGGTLHSAIPIDDSLLIRMGGVSADAWPDAGSGNPGNPQISVGIHIENHRMGPALLPYYHFFVHHVQTASTLHSPPATSVRGADGVVVRDLRGWLHPAAATAMLGYAEDLYRIGLLSKADQELQFLQTALNSSAQLTENPDSYVAILLRVNALRARISSNLDYFGNPAGWTPPLNLAATLQLMQSELAASSPILVTTELVRLNAEQAQAKGNALVTSRDATSASITKLSQQLDALAASIPDLQRESATVAEEEKSFQKACEDQESQLRQNAIDLASPKTSFLSGALKTLGAISKVCPIAQPIVGAVGGGLDILSNIGQDSAWDVIGKIPSMASQFSSANIKASVDNYKRTVNDIAAMDPSNPKQFFGDVENAAQSIGKSMADFKQLQDSTRAPQSKVDELLQQLKATDPSLKALTDRASVLTAEKVVLSAKIDGAIHDIGEYTSQVGTMTENLDALNRDIDQAQDLIDHPAVIAAAAMERTLRERLDYYQYLMIKAYEYFAAAPYEGNRRAAGTADSLLEYIEQAGNAPETAAKAFEAAYTDEIRSLGRDIVQLLVEQGQQNQKLINVELSSDELAALNRMVNFSGSGEDLFISLQDRGVIPLNELAARLIDVKVVQCRCSLNPDRNPGSATIHFDVMVNREGTIRTRTQNLKFRQTGSMTPWGATVDVTQQPPTINQVTHPEGFDQALGVFLGITNAPNYLVSPPLEPGIYVRSRFLTDANVAPTVKIDALTLRLTYSYVPASDVRAVRVVGQSKDGSEPYFYVTTPDLGTYQSGFSEFTRIYGNDATVEIVAPPALGSGRFDGWFLNGSRFTPSNHLTVPLANGSYLFEARFR